MKSRLISRAIRVESMTKGHLRVWVTNPPTYSHLHITIIDRYADGREVRQTYVPKRKATP